MTVFVGLVFNLFGRTLRLRTCLLVHRVGVIYIYIYIYLYIPQARSSPIVGHVELRMLWFCVGLPVPFFKQGKQVETLR